MYHILFNRSFVCEHLGCFHLLIVVTNATMSMDGHLSLWESASNSVGIYLELGLLDHVVILCLSFWGTCILFFVALCYFTFPPAMHRDSSFSTFLPILIFYLLIIAILMEVKCYLMVLISISLITSDVEHLFMYLLSICISFLEKCLFRLFADF